MNYLIKNTIIIFILLFSITAVSAEETTNTWTTNTEKVKMLSLKWVEVIWVKNIELTFDTEINKEESKDIIIRSLWDNPEEIFTLEYIVKKEKVELILEDNLKNNTEYEVIIFSIMGENGSIITSWLDWTIKFKTWDLSIFKVKEEEKIELNSATSEEMKETTTSEEMKETKWWINIEQEEMEKNTEIAAWKIEKLPNTGPELFLIFLLTLALTIWIFFKFRKPLK